MMIPGKKRAKERLNFKMTLGTALLLLTISLLPAQAKDPPLPGDKPLKSFPENVELRKMSIVRELYETTRDRALAFKPLIMPGDIGIWRLYVADGDGVFYTILAQKLNGGFPDYGQGSWIVKRSKRDGSVIQIKIFLRSDPDVFVRIYPFGSDRSKLDMVVYNGILRQEIVLPVPISRILESSIADIATWSSGIVEWDLFSPDPGLYADTRSMVQAIRRRLNELRYADDGAMDENGALVHIADLSPQAEKPGLNCSGFAKWVIDGLLYPLTGTWLPITPLKQRATEKRGSSFTEPYETILDPWFGLDWSRNLALKVTTTLYPRRSPDILANDVNVDAFSKISASANPINGLSQYIAYPPQFESSGYQSNGLKAMLYILALREPGQFYLAAFNKLDSSTEPRLRRYSHISLFFPYFETNGIFQVAVFENATESKLETLVARFPREFAKLIRVPARAEFRGPDFPRP